MHIKSKNPLRAFAILALILAVCIMCLMCGCQQGEGVIVAGSTSVQPYAEVLEEDYALLHPDSLIDIQGGGSSAGITAVESGTADIGMSSRMLKDEESHLWSVEIAKDGLAIIIHPDNQVGDLTLEQVRGIYAGDIVNWSELGGSDARIHVIAREEGSGTRSAFEDLVMDEDSRITPRAIVQNSNGAVRMLVSDDKYAVGFISLGLVDHLQGMKPVKALRLDGVEPSRENVINGTYSLYRPFLFVCDGEPSGEAKNFIDFVMSPEGQDILVAEGLIPAVEGEVD